MHWLIRNISATFFLVVIINEINLASDSLKVCVIADFRITSLLCSNHEGTYQLWVDNKPINRGVKEFIYLIELNDDSLVVRTENVLLGKGKIVCLKSVEDFSSLKLKPVEPNKSVRIYGDDIEFQIINNQIKIFNKINIEDYVAGVVESEVGTRAPFEYYKVQSVLCRTYALSHMRKHLSEGFNLCDGVHCQAYFGKQSRNQQIEKATRETQNKVIVDNQNQLIVAAFHSNSGGLTVNSEDIWNSYKSYLRSVTDSFSLSGRNATWQKTFTKREWLNYFHTKYKVSWQDTTLHNQLLSYKPSGREIYFSQNPKILLRDMRVDLNLKSTYFSVELNNDTVKLIGLGYGHGVGLSQEGAMQMAKLGYSYLDIIRFYYKNVNLIDLHMLDFFKD